MARTRTYVYAGNGKDSLAIGSPPAWTFIGVSYYSAYPPVTFSKPNDDGFRCWSRRQMVSVGQQLVFEVEANGPLAHRFQLLSAAQVVSRQSPRKIKAKGPR